MLIDPKDLGRAMRRLRAERPQAQVARRGGVRRATWSLWEKGHRAPRERSLERIVRGLGCTRLQLEEMAWQCHKERLSGEPGLFPQPWPSWGLAPAPGPTTLPAPAGPGQEPEDRLLNERRLLYLRFASVIEELFLLAARERA